MELFASFAKFSVTEIQLQSRELSEESVDKKMETGIIGNIEVKVCLCVVQQIDHHQAVDGKVEYSRADDVTSDIFKPEDGGGRTSRTQRDSLLFPF